MDEQIINIIQQGNTTAFIDGTVTSNLAYRPQFVSNNYKEGRKVISSIEEELLSCEEFSISVAFITMSGITPFLQTFKALENRGIHGRILTTDYLLFSDHKALDKLAELSNIEVRMYRSKESEIGFHTKGYIFRNSEIYSVIVGSSNMTLSALTQNKEWNTRLVSTGDGEFIHNILQEYDDLWTSEFTSDYSDFIDNYRTQYDIIKKQRKIAKAAEIPSLEQYRLQPNSMQVAFISSLKRIIDKREQRALLISATGERGIFMTGGRNLGF